MSEQEIDKLGENMSQDGFEQISRTKSSIDNKMERCTTWVNSQKKIQHQYENIEDESTKILANNILTCNVNKRKRPNSNCNSKCSRKTKDELTLECEWKKCHFITDNYTQFQMHVKFHMHELPIKKNDEDEEFYACLWDICFFETNCSATIIRHVNFHAYHTKIKTLGLNIRGQKKLPRCTQDSVTRNTIPETLTFICNWVDCNDDFQSPQDYYNHIKCHVISTTPISKIDNKFNCGWRGCNIKRPRMNQLLEHCRTHSGERLVACPHCGTMFSSNTKLTDHCFRQIPEEVCAENNFLCTKCSKFFPSNRLLRDHLRLHINNYKCSMCDMTCPTPSTLAKHIRYRHVDDRVFKCCICPHASVTKKDLEIHMSSHDANNKYVCDEDGCTFTCRSLPGYTRHVNSHHGDGMPLLYCCHCCNERFPRGANLTKHLINLHGFYWPPGHSRFTYKEDADGFFRLQTTRYESIEVSEQILNTTTNNELIKSMNHTYEVKMKMPLTASDVANVVIKTLDDTPIYASSYGPEDVSNIIKRDLRTNSKSKSKNNCSHSKNKFTGLIKEESNHTDSNLGSIEDFSVMRRYIKESKKVIITINDVDAEGEIIKSEVVDSKNIVMKSKSSKKMKK